MPTIPKNGNSPELSLIFVNYRSAAALKRSLVPLEDALRSGKTEGIVVNNDPSESDSLRRLSKRFPIRIIRAPENIGFGAASNRGAAEAGADLIAFLNPDTRLVQGTCDDISSHFRSHPETGIAGAALIDRKGKPEPWSAGPVATLLGIIGNNLSLYRGIPPREDRPREVGFVSGAALFIQKPIFEKLGGFDKRFFLYFEDMDLCLRARKAGYQVIRLPKPVFSHEGGASRKSESEQKRHYYSAQDLYFEKNRPRWEGRLLRLLRISLTSHVERKS